jgi:hypothetical protein
MEDVSTEATDVRRDPLRYNTLAYEIHLMEREHVFDLFVDFGGHPPDQHAEHARLPPMGENPCEQAL